MNSRLRRFNHHQRAFQNTLWGSANYIRRGEHHFRALREHLDVMTEEARELGDDAPLAALEASRQQLASIKTKLDLLFAILADHCAPSPAAESEPVGEPGMGRPRTCSGQTCHRMPKRMGNPTAPERPERC